MDPQTFIIGALGAIVIILTLALITLWRIMEARSAHDRERVAMFERMAYIDPLTELATRRRFDEEIARRVQGANNGENSRDLTIGLVLLDLDDFKPVNDRHGHPAGDKVLRQVARELEACVRPGDLVARLGGDEFGIILPGADADAVSRIGHRIDACIRRLRIHLSNNKVVQIGTSVGGISRTGPGLDPAQLIAWADEHLLRAKYRKGSGDFQVVVESERTEAPRDGE